MYNMCVGRHSQQPREGVRFSKTVVKGGRESADMAGNQMSPVIEKQDHLPTELSLQSQLLSS